MAKAWGRGQGGRGVAKAVGAWSRPWGCCHCLGGIAKAEGRGQAVVAWPRPWVRGQRVRGVVKQWGHSQVGGGVAKAVGA